MEEAGKDDIVVQMSMYSDNEQVGSLEKSYTKNDEQITTYSGDIVLYSGDKIVVFYGSNSWAYTRLGKMNIPESNVTELLSNGDITLKNSDYIKKRSLQSITPVRDFDIQYRRY